MVSPVGDPLHPSLRVLTATMNRSEWPRLCVVPRHPFVIPAFPPLGKRKRKTNAQGKKGLGGQSIRSYERDLQNNEWWGIIAPALHSNIHHRLSYAGVAATAASDDGVGDGALLCTFNTDGSLCSPSANIVSFIHSFIVVHVCLLLPRPAWQATSAPASASSKTSMASSGTASPSPTTTPSTRRRRSSLRSHRALLLCCSTPPCRHTLTD